MHNSYHLYSSNETNCYYCALHNIYTHNNSSDYHQNISRSSLHHPSDSHIYYSFNPFIAYSFKNSDNPRLHNNLCSHHKNKNHYDI